MAGDVATAFVRIRPNTTGFKSEAEAGLKGQMLGIGKEAGKVLGVALGVTAAAEFVKGIAEHASDVQRQVRGLSASFGPAGKEIEEFADNSAKHLGISAHEAEKTANTFGVLFGQLGIGQKQAATMTVNLEKLVGAVSQIRNVDPEVFFSTLPRALLGNVRGLRSMGIAVDANAIKMRAAADAGHVIVGALTQAQKATAIYELATDHLNPLLAQAQAHQSDFAVQMRVLNAEFDNQRDILGKKLLPILESLAHLAGQVMPVAFHVLEIAITGITDVFQALGSLLDKNPFGGVKTAVEALVVTLLAIKFTHFIGGLVKTKTAAAESAGAMEGAATSFQESVTKMTASAETGAKEIEASFGEMSKVVSSEVAATNNVLKGAFAPTGNVRKLSADEARRGKIRSLLTGTADDSNVAGNRVSPQFARGAALSSGGESFFLAPKGAAQAEQSASKIKAALAGIGKAAQSSGKVASFAFTGLSTATTGITSRISSGFSSLFTGIKAAAIGTAAGIKAAFISALPILALTIAIQLLIEHFGLVKQVAIGVVKAIAESWHGLKDVLIGLAKIIGGGMAFYLTAPLRVFLEAVSHVTGVLDKIGIHIGGSVKSGIAALKSISTDFAGEGAEQVARGGKAIGAAFAKNVRIGAKDEAAKHKKEGGLITRTADETELTIQQLKVNAEKLKKAITGAGNVQSDAVKNARENLVNLGQQLKEAITQENTDIYNAVESAKANTLSLANTLSSSVSQLLDAPIQAAQEKIQTLADNQSLNRLRRSILLPGGKELSKDPKKALQELKTLASSSGTVSRGAIQAFSIQYQQALLTVKQDQVNHTKETTQRRLSLLADELNSGKISVKKFQHEVRKTLAADKIPYQAAGRFLGKAFIDGFHQQTKDLFAQAIQVSKSPKVAGTSGFHTEIVKPLVTLHNDQKRIEDINRQINQGQRGLEHAQAQQAHKALVEAKKQTKLQAQYLGILTQIERMEKRREEDRRNSRKGGAAAKNTGETSKQMSATNGTGG